jgi:rare lipoprotein A
MAPHDFAKHCGTVAGTSRMNHFSIVSPLDPAAPQMHARNLIAAIALAPIALASPQTDALASPAHGTLVNHGHVQRGRISWYGADFAGRKTASGERFDPHALTMAHRSLPLGTIVLVTNDDNGRRVTLRVNDRGPYRDDRVADVSRAASRELGFQQTGITIATIEVLWVPPGGHDGGGEAKLASSG